METTITNIIDKYLQHSIDLGLDRLPMNHSDIEVVMISPQQDLTEEWKKWIPVDSTVTDIEIQKLETEIGYPLPESYKIFLKHKHFYELFIGEVSFCSHVINRWQSGLIKMVFDGYPPEFLIFKGFIPFANYSDWGHLCFDTSGNADGNEYKIVLWDHENWDEVEFKYENFTAMMLALDAEEKNI